MRTPTLPLRLLLTLPTILLTLLPLTTASSSCISTTDARVIVSQFTQLQSNFSASLAQVAVAKGFTDQSDSVNTVINNGGNGVVLPLGNLTFTSKTEYISFASSSPTLPTFQILNTWIACDTITLRFKIPLTPSPVQGISVIEVVNNCRGNGYESGSGIENGTDAGNSGYNDGGNGTESDAGNEGDNAAAGGWQIKRVFGELNSAAWLGDDGVSCGVA